MALTILAPQDSGLVQVTSSDSPPGVPPQDPAAAAIHYMVDGSGQPASVFFWSQTVGWSQIPIVPADGNLSEGLVCGWEGPHSAPHMAPAHAEVAMPCMLVPRFSVAAPSNSPIPFELHDLSGAMNPSLLATGVFPAGAKHADVTACSLVDVFNLPAERFGFSPDPSAPVAHYAAVPVGGHGAMPADGETFMVHFLQVY